MSTATLAQRLHAGGTPHGPATAREGWFRGRDGEMLRTTPLLDADVDLAERLPQAELAVARRHLVVAVQQLSRGTWTPATEPGRQPFALLVLKGGLMHGSCVGDRWSTEILGPGDVLRPWEEGEAFQGLGARREWQALESVELAVLDRRFVQMACRWPELVDELLARSVRRSRHLALLRSIAGIRRLDDRLLLLLRILADRWGRVGPDGVRLQVRLTHETLARLAGAQRPSVSTALARLGRDGAIARQGGLFVLPSHPSPAQPAGRPAVRPR